MKIAVIGAGGVGGWLAARLADAGADVHVLARGAHLAAIRAHGLRLTSPAGDVVTNVAAVSDAGEIGPCEVVLFCVKSYDGDAAMGSLPGLCRDGTAVISLQNGIDNIDRLAPVVGWPQVVGGLAIISSTISEPGVVVHSGGPASVVFGELDGSESERTSALLQVLRVPGVDARRSDHIRVELWDKFAFLCAMAGTTATMRLPLGDVMASPASAAMFEAVVGEVYAVARAMEVPLAADAVAVRMAFVRRLDAHIYASLYYDLVAGRRIELDALHGTVVRLGAAYGVPTPMSTAVEAILRPHADRAVAG